MNSRFNKITMSVGAAISLALASASVDVDPAVDCPHCIITIASAIPSGGYSDTLEESLPAPKDVKTRQYLGIPEASESFKLKDVETELLVVLVFDLYCHVCSQSAPNISLLESQLAEQAKCDTRIVGLGRGDTQFEIETFARKNKLTIPVFSDRKKTLSDSLGAKRTPSGYAFIKRGESFEQIASFSGYFNKSKLKEFTSDITEVCSESDTD